VYAESAGRCQSLLLRPVPLSVLCSLFKALETALTPSHVASPIVPFVTPRKELKVAAESAMALPRMPMSCMGFLRSFSTNS